MKTVTFDSSKLLAVSKNGLEYVDDQGCRCIIDFQTCRENVRNRLKMPEWRWARQPDYVGFRDVLGKPPHITLATNPATRFLFPMPGASDFDEFQVRLFDEAGVSTFDVT